MDIRKNESVHYEAQITDTIIKTVTQKLTLLQVQREILRESTGLTEYKP
ncbi:MAG TPA: hypothetical protein VFE98_06690 [Candidatus Bathyarchaeia archaeon]|nr:hypothetical protein [Candidatus Bathyarchaeia archaeon]